MKKSVVKHDKYSNKKPNLLKPNVVSFFVSTSFRVTTYKSEIYELLSYYFLYLLSELFHNFYRENVCNN